MGSEHWFWIKGRMLVPAVCIKSHESMQSWQNARISDQLDAMRFCLVIQAHKIINTDTEATIFSIPNTNIERKSILESENPILPGVSLWSVWNKVALHAERNPIWRWFWLKKHAMPPPTNILANDSQEAFFNAAVEFNKVPSIWRCTGCCACDAVIQLVTPHALLQRKVFHPKSPLCCCQKVSEGFIVRDFTNEEEVWPKSQCIGRAPTPTREQGHTRVPGPLVVHGLWRTHLPQCQ